MTEFIALFDQRQTYSTFCYYAQSSVHSHVFIEVSS
jgi:hypothetical protein